MKKSSNVSIAFVSSLAASLLQGCEPDGDWVEAKRCVSRNLIVMDDRECEGPLPPSGRGGYGYYYGGHGYYPGDPVWGGRWTPKNGVIYRSPSQVQRGGFGSTGRAFVARGGSFGS